MKPLTHLPMLLAATLLALPTLAFSLEPSVLPTAPDPSSILNSPSSFPAAAPGVLTPLLDGLLGKYGWLTTVLLAIGSLRILFKPVMLVLENALKNDAAKFAEL